MSTLTVSSKGRRWLAAGHPWLYRDDMQRTDAQAGELVRVLDTRENVLGFAFYSAQSRIAARMVTRTPTEPDRAFWQARIARAIAARERLGLLAPDGACRLIAGDADGVPGLVVDRYARTLVLQSGTLAADRMRELVVELVAQALPYELACVLDRSDSAVRRLEGLEKRVELLRGELPAELLIREDELVYEVDIQGGHKTGHYLDQRDNRRAAALKARDVDVLDAFSYDGLFAIRAAQAGARSVVCIDQSQPALDRALRNAQRNGVAHKLQFERADCMVALRARATAGQQFGLVIVDPPAFAKNRAELIGAARGYVELNRRALRLVAPGGFLVSASCSYNVRPELFLEWLGLAAQHAERDAFLEHYASAAPDHPHLLTLPESAYLKCAFVRVEHPSGLPPLS